MVERASPSAKVLLATWKQKINCIRCSAQGCPSQFRPGVHDPGMEDIVQETFIIALLQHYDWP